MKEAILGVDQGTTRTKAIVFDRAASPLAFHSVEVPLTYPRPGWVETDAAALYQSVLDTARTAIEAAKTPIAAMGLANQGETVVAWNRRTGMPIHNAIGWQDRRTSAECEELRSGGAEPFIRERTGLPLDPYFSATKLRWILDHLPEARSLAKRGDLLAGTTDAFFLWRLTGRHQTDHSTASRTMLYNLRDGDWDEEMLRLFAIPRSILPCIELTSGPFGDTGNALSRQPIPITASLADQQAALFGQACHQSGDTKVTYGTGAFILLNAGKSVPTSAHGLVPTVAWALDGEITYALDGGMYVAGAVVQWLRDGLGIIRDAAETADLAAAVPDSGGVFFVPALAGLAAPYWDSHARGTIVGITRGTTRAHIVRAALEGIAFRTRDIVEAMVADTGVPLREIKVDGGASSNSFLMQRLATILGCEVSVAATAETTALGVALISGRDAGVWRDIAETAALWREGTRYLPAGPGNQALYARWREAVTRSRDWASDEDDLEA